jgi:2-haloacid dehalogenase
MLDFSQFEWISFDCYGTLIDWESGILGYLAPMLERKYVFISDEDVLSMYSEIEPRLQAAAYRPYREILAMVMREYARELRFDLTIAEAAGLADSLSQWKPFPDTNPALQRLKSRYKLAILSNIDDDMFMSTSFKLDVKFDYVLTAQKLHSYKPARQNFETLLHRLLVKPNHILHVAESLYHDVVPAKELGITTVWVNRRQGKPAAASKLAHVKPDLEVRDLAELASLAVPEADTATTSG